MIGTRRHQEALAAWEEKDQFEDIQSGLAKFKRQQKKEENSTSNHFSWIREGRKLNNAASSLSKPIVQGISKLLIDVQKEKDLDEIFELCGVDPSRSDEAIRSLQDGIVVLQNPASVVYRGQDVLRLAFHIKDAVAEFEKQRGYFSAPGRQHASDGILSNKKKTDCLEGAEDVVEGLNGMSQGNALCAQLLLDMRETLADLEDELDHKYATELKEAQDRRKEVMMELKAESANEGSLHSKNLEFPQQLAKAFASLRLICEKNDHFDEEDADKIDLLENELMREFFDARERYDGVVASLEQRKIGGERWDEKCLTIFKSILSSRTTNPSGLTSKGKEHLVGRLKKGLPDKSVTEIVRQLDSYQQSKINKSKEKAASEEHKKKHQEILELGLKEVARLRNSLMESSEQAEVRSRNGLKRKEVHLRLKMLRKEREEVEKGRVTKQLQEQAKLEDLTISKDVQQTQRKLESKQVLWGHQSQTRKESEEALNAMFRKNFEQEVERLKQNNANKERTLHRQDQYKGKLAAQRVADEEAMRAEERRLGRLSALAASTPYYQTIMNTTPDIHRSTEARKNDVYEKCNDLADFQCGLQKLRSFTNERLFSDARFRLGNALHEAGVAHTNYARDAVRSVIPRTEERTTGIKPY